MVLRFGTGDMVAVLALGLSGGMAFVVALGSRRSRMAASFVGVVYIVAAVLYIIFHNPVVD